MTTSNTIYLDHAATTPVRPEALAAMWPYFSQQYGNPSSLHRLGRETARALRTAREQVAGVLGCSPGELVFTGSGTEADNLALRGVALARRQRGAGSHLIVSAVEQGRVIYANIRKFVFFLLSSNMAEVMIIFLASLAGLPMPLTVIQLLWLNLLTDGAPALALAMEKGDPDIMDRPPRPKTESIIHGPMKSGIVIQTIVQTAAVLTAFIIGLYWTIVDQIPGGQNMLSAVLQYDWRGVDVQTAETMAFVTLSLCELFRAYTVRSERTSIFKLGVFSNKYMQIAVLVSITLTLLVVLVPFLQPIFNTHMPSAEEWVIIFALATLPAIVEEITKFFLRRQSPKTAAA